MYKSLSRRNKTQLISYSQPVNFPPPFPLKGGGKTFSQLAPNTGQILFTLRHKLNEKLANPDVGYSGGSSRKNSTCLRLRSAGYPVKVTRHLCNSLLLKAYILGDNALCGRRRLHWLPCRICRWTRPEIKVSRHQPYPIQPA